MKCINFRNRTLLLAALVALLALLAYRSYFGIQFLEFDIAPKLVYHSGTDVGEVLRIFTQTDHIHIAAYAGYRPFSSLILWLLFLASGFNLVPYHFLSFALHAINSILVFLLAKKLIKGSAFPFLAAAIFALHAINMNAVLLVSRLPELMVAFFLLASLLSFMKFLENGGKRFYALAALFCLLGILSKELGIIIPFVLFLYALVFLREKHLATLLKRALNTCSGFFSPIFLYIALSLLTIGRLPGYNYDFPGKRSEVPVSFFNLLLYPIEFLNTGFFPWLIRTIKQPPLESAVLLLAIAFSAFILWRFSKKAEDRNALFLFYWLFALLFAFTAFNNLGIWYLYLPTIPFSLLIALFLKRQSQSLHKSALPKAISLLLLLLIISLIALSPLFVHYRQPLVAARTAQSISSQTLAAASSLPENSKIFLLNYPESMRMPENGFTYLIIMVNGASMRALLDFHFPEKNITTSTLTRLILTAPPEHANIVHYTDGNCVFVAENRSMKSAILLSHQSHWVWREEPLQGIDLNQSRSRWAERIKITFQGREKPNEYLFIYDGQQVHTVKVSDFCN